MRIDPAKVYIFLSAKRNDSACRMPAWGQVEGSRRGEYLARACSSGGRGRPPGLCGGVSCMSVTSGGTLVVWVTDEELGEEAELRLLLAIEEEQRVARGTQVRDRSG